MDLAHQKEEELPMEQSSSSGSHKNETLEKLMNADSARTQQEIEASKKRIAQIWSVFNQIGQHVSEQEPKIICDSSFQDVPSSDPPIHEGKRALITRNRQFMRKKEDPIVFSVRPRQLTALFFVGVGLGYIFGAGYIGYFFKSLAHACGQFYEITQTDQKSE